MFNSRSSVLFAILLIVAVGFAVLQPFNPPGNNNPEPISFTVDLLFLSAKGDTVHHEFIDLIVDPDWDTSSDTLFIGTTAPSEFVIDKADTFRLALARKDPDGITRVKQVFNHYTEQPGSFIKRTVHLDDAEQMIAQ
jgi:hypothetical protein